MKAKDVMSMPVITVAPDTELHAIATLLSEHRISGVLVVDAGRVVGTVGSGDLVHRHEIGTDVSTADRNWWQRLTQTDPASAAYVRSHGARARDVMNHEVVSVSEATPLSEVAAIFEARHVRRVPVLLDGGMLVGIITRADLVRAIAAASCAKPTPRPGAQPDDEAIRLQLLDELGRQPWWSHNWSELFVHQGVVRYVGVFRNDADRDAARIAAENIPGVRAVEDWRMRFGDWQPMF